MLIYYELMEPQLEAELLHSVLLRGGEKGLLECGDFPQMSGDPFLLTVCKK